MFLKSETDRLDKIPVGSGPGKSDCPTDYILWRAGRWRQGGLGAEGGRGDGGGLGEEGGGRGDGEAEEGGEEG